MPPYKRRPKWVDCFELSLAWSHDHRLATYSINITRWHRMFVEHFLCVFVKQFSVTGFEFVDDME